MAWLGGPALSTGIVIETSDGVITAIESGPDDTAQRLDGIVLPGLVNTHSHAFHRLLRGRTHRQGGDFWVWREKMYELASSLTPESYEAIATAVFIEMALAGVTTVGEFHYVHHQPGGTPYEDPNEMGEALIRAARSAGIGICLLDAGYFNAGFDDRPLGAVQRRFRDATPERWIERATTLAATHADADDVRVGLAPHSVRAVPQSGLRLVAESDSGLPVHIHLSEQPAENTECLEATGLTPTGLLADTGLLRPGTTLVHATHLGADDIATIGSS
ncbi:MAG: formimidoylglutamate deiminase, partial [Acidimicrobiia bacterium]